MYPFIKTMLMIRIVWFMKQCTCQWYVEPKKKIGWIIEGLADYSRDKFWTNTGKGKWKLPKYKNTITPCLWKNSGFFQMD